jgi:hypothetical protein
MSVFSASFASIAEFALNATTIDTGSFVQTSQTASMSVLFAQTASYIDGLGGSLEGLLQSSQTASMTVFSASFASVAEYALNAQNVDTASFVQANQDSVINANLLVSGSLGVSGSLYLNFWLGAGTTFTSGTLATSWGAAVNANTAVGQVNIADNTANDFLITGVQLEAGEQASGFEFMPVDIDLFRCQRYYYLHASGNNNTVANGSYYNSTELNSLVTFKQTMRTAPSISVVSGTDYYRIARNGATDFINDFTIYLANTNLSAIYNATQASGTGGQAGVIYTSNASAFIAFESEL